MADENLNFDELKQEAANNIKINQKKEEEQAKKNEEDSSITSGWTAKPFIIFGVICAVLIAISVYIVYIM